LATGNVQQVPVQRTKMYKNCEGWEGLDEQIRGIEKVPLCS